VPRAGHPTSARPGLPAADQRKAERFIRTPLAGSAYGALYRNSSERAAALDAWPDYYNHRRRHSALGHKPPIARLIERTKLLEPHT
jgi:transposase InsO family protein